MKQVLLFIVAILMAHYTYAQPARGVIAGGNMSFYSDAKDNSILASSAGLQIGYQWTKPIANNFAFGVAGMFSQVASVSGAVKSDLLSGQNLSSLGQLETYFAVPLSINYSFKNAYLGTGYEYAYNISQNALLNKNNHSVLMQLGYKLKFMDVMLKYNIGLNQEKRNINSYKGELRSELSLPKINNLQLSVIIPIGKQL